MADLLTDTEMLAWTTAAQRKEGEIRQAEAIRELPGTVAGSALSIASGSITPTQAYHIIDTESGAATDGLDLIDPSSLGDGRIIILSIADASRVVTIKHGSGGTGQIYTSTGADLVLDNTQLMVALVRRGDAWYELCRSAVFADAAATVAGTRTDRPTTPLGVATALDVRMAQFATCATAAATAAKFVVCDDFVLKKGITVFVTFANTNAVAGALTLNVNSTGDIPICDESGNAVSATKPAYFHAGFVVEFFYNGTSWMYKRRIASSYYNGGSWYRIYTDGWIEQGGFIGGTGSYGLSTVTLIVPYKTTNYFVNVGITWTGAASWFTSTGGIDARCLTDITGPTNEKTTSSFQIQSESGHIWFTCGF